MTARQIAKSAAVVLQADDIEEALNAAEEHCDIDALDADARTLVKCIDLALSEIRGDGFPCVCNVELDAVGGEIVMPRGDVLTLLKVEKSGAPVRFSVANDKITVGADGTYTVTYSRVHGGIADLDGEIEVGAFTSTDMVAYLASRNYCLVTGRSDEASVWDQLYTGEAAKRRLTRRAKLPRRMWR